MQPYTCGSCHVGILNGYIRASRGNVRNALAKYNGGPGNYRSRGGAIKAARQKFRPQRPLMATPFRPGPGPIPASRRGSVASLDADES